MENWLKKISQIVIKKRFFINFLLLFLAVILFFIFAEILSRFFFDESQFYEKILWDDLQRRKTSDKEALEKDKQFYVNKDNALLYKTEDNSLLGERYLDGNYLIFSFDKIIKKEKEADVFRVAVLGDSFTMGGGVEEKRSELAYARQLDKMLNEKNDYQKTGIKKFEVLTFTDYGINTAQELAILKDLAISYKPDLVILQYCDNDIDPPRYPFGSFRDQFYISPRSYLLKIGNRFVPAFPFFSKETNWLLLERSAFLRFLSFKVNVFLSNAQTSEAASFASLREIKKIAEENGVPLIIINAAPASLVADACNDKASVNLHNDIKSLTANLAVPFFDICDYVKDIHSISSKKTIDNGYHYNQEGHRLMAEILSKAIWTELSRKK